MKKIFLLALTLIAGALSGFAAPGAEFAIRKVEISYPSSPDFQNNNDPGVKWAAQKWVKMEVTFDAVPEFTDELAFNYYVLFGDRLLVGHVNHVNIGAGQSLHSVMYLSPKAIARLIQKKQANVNVNTLPIKQITVSISKPGVVAPLAIGSLKPSGTADWWTTMKQEEGFLLNKSETPFAPLTWDYYEAVKSASGR